MTRDADRILHRPNWYNRKSLYSGQKPGVVNKDFVIRVKDSTVEDNTSTGHQMRPTDRITVPNVRTLQQTFTETHLIRRVTRLLIEQ